MVSSEREFSLEIKQKMHNHYNADTDCILSHSQDTEIGKKIPQEICMKLDESLLFVELVKKFIPDD